MTRWLMLWVAAAVALTACGPADPHRQIVCLVDMTGSVPKETRVQAVEALTGLVSSLRRGDRLTVMPIAGDAAMDAPGRVVRIAMPMSREPYDADLARATETALEDLHALITAAADTPYMQTDLLGSIELAAEEFARSGGGARNVLVLLTDFIQDDRAFNFNRDGRLADAPRARAFAAQLAVDAPGTLEGVHALLGSVPSADARRLARARRDAIRVFWMELLAQRGATVEWVTDGLGMFPDALNRLDSSPPALRRAAFLQE